MKRFAAAMSAVVIAGLPFASFAQSDATTSGALPAQYPTPQGLTSCFNYYTFGSVPVSLTSSLSEVAAGASVGFQGTITNNNRYPIVDASVYVKIFRERDASGAKDPNGPDVVDSFQAAGPITLQAGQSEPISFSWQVPRGAQSGDYQAATYVVSSDDFNLFGLTFTDDVVGSLTPFEVVLGQTGSVSFDKTSVTVGSQPFYFAAFPPSVAATGSVAVSASVDNTTASPAKAVITWNLYSWDSLTPQSLIDRQTQTVSIDPYSTTTVSYTATDMSHSVYYLVGTLENGATKSIIGVRFIRNGIDTPRLNFAGVTGYPLTPSTTLFACAHDEGSAEADNSTLTAQIVPTDPVERFVDSILGLTPVLSYSGAIPGQEVALASAVKAEPASFTLVTDLYQNGTLVDQASIPYSCTALGVSCGYSYTDIAVGGAIVLVLLIIALIILIRRRKRNGSAPDPML